MFTSFGYFANAEDDRQVCCNLHESLRDGSRLVLDMMGKEVLARVFQQRDWAEAEDILLLSERTVHDNWSWIKVREIYIDGGIRYDGGFEHRLYSASELSSLARTAGFSRVQVLGGLDGCPYDQNATRLVLMAQK
jgi:hypothetical protein